MPELPEVETVRRGLEPFLAGAAIRQVTLHRPDLRFAFPQGFAAGLEGRRIEVLGRRAKYLLFTLSDGAIWLSHLGMTGAFHIAQKDTPPAPHTHFQASLSHPRHGEIELSYIDPRRFGFMDLFAAGAPNRYVDPLGPEPLGNALHAQFLAQAFARRKGPVKSVLLDQRVIAGLGNIYVCEALFRAGISPLRPAQSLVRRSGSPTMAIERLAPAIGAVLLEALDAGGSTLRDFRNSEGRPGYFQHSFAVYGREGAQCMTPGCVGHIVRTVQSGRSSFYCPRCQR